MPIVSIARFSDRAEDYAKYRPGYPASVLDFCRREMGLTPAWVVADLGSGTGIFSRLLLGNGNRVYGVEPNASMRQMAEVSLAGYPGFTSVAAPAEATTLPDASVNLVTAATAFHWFDPAQARAEALRILRPGGWALLVWNIRHAEDNAFLAAYDALLAFHAEGYTGGAAGQRSDPSILATFFGTPDYCRFVCPHAQWLDFEGLKGRVLSSSYCPKPGHPRHAPLMQGLRTLFEAHHQGGQVRLDYRTHAFAAPLGSRAPL
jgi:ubiquinone/menaquinone biosynthesis C-methylase UbiE